MVGLLAICGILPESSFALWIVFAHLITLLGKKIGSVYFVNLFILMAHSTKKKVCHWSRFWIDPAGDSWQEMLYPKLLWRTSVICWQEFWQFSRTNPISSSFSFSATTLQFLYIPCSFRSSSSILQFIKPLCSFIRYSFTFLCIYVFLHMVMHLLICIQTHSSTEVQQICYKPALQLLNWVVEDF